MYFTRTILTSLVSALYIAGGVRADDCDDGPFASHNFMGYPGRPAHFCATKWTSGAVVTGIEVWATAWQIKGIRFEFSDSSDSMQGQADGDRHDVLRWNAADKVTDMKLAVNYAGDALGLVHVEVGDKKLDVRSDTGSFNGDEWDIGSGIMLGHAGDAGGMITNWIPLFMGQATGKAEIVDIKFNDNLDEVNKQQKGIDTAGMVVQNFITNLDPLNSTDADQGWEFNGEQEVQTSTSFSTTDESVFSMSESISLTATIGIPEVDSASATSTTEFGYTMSHSKTQELGKSNTITVGQKLTSADSSPLKPGHTMNCTSTAVSGTYTGGYVATVRVTVGGKEYDLQRPGEFKGISWFHGQIACETILNTDIPTGAAHVIQAKDTIKSKSARRVRRSLPFRA